MAALFATVAAAVHAQAPRPQPPPQLPPQPPQSRSVSKYIVGPNDVVSITFFNDTELSGKFPVQADGSITFKHIGRVVVGGQAVQAVEKEMTEKLGRLYKNPQVAVSVDQFRSQQVFVWGAVRQPGALQFQGQMTLIEALSKVGDITDKAGDEVLVARANSEPFRVSLQQLRAQPQVHNIQLRSDDTISVAEAERLYVSGFVARPGEYVYRPGMTVRQAIALAGGVTEKGSERRIEIHRTNPDGTDQKLKADLQDLVQPKDTIKVNQKFL
jgi:polysaccharide export outer membrane protein